MVAAIAGTCSFQVRNKANIVYIYIGLCIGVTLCTYISDRVLTTARAVFGLGDCFHLARLLSCRKLQKGAFVVRFTTVVLSKNLSSLVVLAADKAGDIQGMLLHRQGDSTFELTAPRYILGHCASIITCMVNSASGSDCILSVKL